MLKKEKSQMGFKIKPKSIQGIQSRGSSGKPDLEEVDDYVKIHNLKNDVLKKEKRIEGLNITLKKTLEAIDILEKNLAEKKKENELLITENTKLKKSGEESKNLKEEVGELKETIKEKDGNLQIQEKEKNQEIQEIDKKYKDTLEKLKDLLCSEELLNDQNLKEEELPLLEKLWGLIIKRGIKRETSKESEKPKVLKLEDYLKSEKCVCGKSKKFGSKGCPNCRKEADKFNKRDNVGMEKSWEKVWSSYGVSMEYP